jgi:bifunctional non-homologous end joining protein LigD
MSANGASPVSSLATIRGLVILRQTFVWAGHARGRSRTSRQRPKQKRLARDLELGPVRRLSRGAGPLKRIRLAAPAALFHSPMLLRAVPPSGFIEPCLPSPADRLPNGPDWVHEIKHDGYRLMARRDPIGIRLLTRNGHDWSPRYPLIVEAVNRLKVRSCLIDGEAVACDDNGLAVFERLRRKPEGRHVFLFAFDLLELDGEDLRRAAFETRKATLASLLRGCLPGLRLNEHLTHPGDVVFRHACKMGLEGIVSKRLGSRYVSGRTRDWLKFKNPEAPAVKREAEEDWGR